MALTAEQTTAQNFKDFYDRIRPLLNAQHYHVDRNGQELRRAYLTLNANQNIVSNSTNVTVNLTKASGTFEVSNNSVIIPSGVTVQIDATLGATALSSSVIPNFWYAIYNGNTQISCTGTTYQTTGYAGNKSINFQWENDTNSDVALTLKVGQVYNGDVSLAANNCSMTVQEIGRIVDPIQYLSNGDTLEETPVGNIISYMGNNVPKHYLACDGHEYPIGSYPELEAHFIAEFGSVNYFGGDGTSSFAVPDLRGEFLRGTGTNSHINQGSGANVGMHQDGTATPSISAGYDGLYINNIPASGTNGSDNIDSGYKKNASNRSASVNIAGTWSTTANNMVASRPTNTSVQYCIKYESTYHVIVPSHAYKVHATYNMTLNTSNNAYEVSALTYQDGDPSLIDGTTFKAPVNGWYAISFNSGQESKTKLVVQYLQIFHNGTMKEFTDGSDSQVASNTTYWGINVNKVVYLEKGDTANIRIWTQGVAISLPTWREASFCLLTSNVNENIIAGGEVYSTTEQVIGTHIDGKPLYQITYKKDNVSNGATTVESSFITNKSVDRVINIEACRLGTNGYIDSFDADNNYVCINNGNIVINMAQTGVTWSWLITIKYTKTTDVANTYTYKNSLLLTRPDQWTDGVEYDFGGGLYGVRFTGTVSTSVAAGSNVWTQIVNRGVGLSSAPKMMNFGGWIEFVTNGQKSVTPANSPRIWQLQTSVYFAMGGSFRMQVISGVDGTTPSTMAIPADGKYDVWVTYMK